MLGISDYEWVDLVIFNVENYIVKELRILIGYILLNYELTLQNKNQKINQFGGNLFVITRIEPQIPIVIKEIAN